MAKNSYSHTYPHYPHGKNRAKKHKIVNKIGNIRLKNEIKMKHKEHESVKKL